MEDYKGKLTPLLAPTNGVWLRPETARHYFNSGKGISIGTMMNKIYSGRLNGLVRNDYTGWYVFIGNDALNNKIELQAA